MNKQQQILGMIANLNYVLFFFLSFVSLLFANFTFTFGVISGGSMAMINFYFLEKTIKIFLNVGIYKNYGFVLAKYYVRFIITSLAIIFFIQYKIVNPFGLFLGLSIIVISMFITAVIELKKLILKEAV